MHSNYCLKDKITALTMKIKLPSSFPLPGSPGCVRCGPGPAGPRLQSRGGEAKGWGCRPGQGHTATPSSLVVGGGVLTLFSEHLQ